MATQIPPAFEMSERAKPGDIDGRTTAALLRDLIHEFSSLFRKEISLATAEVSSILPRFMLAFGSVAAGGAVAFAGFLVLLAAAVLGLAQVVSAWLAALIVGCVVLLIGVALLMTGIKKVKPADLTPVRAVESLKKDKAVLTGDQR